MKDANDPHAPTDEFVEYLARDILRAARHDARFAPSSTVRPHSYTRRLANGLGLAAAAAVTLFTGIVLGASASYAVAAPPSAPRSALSIFPIRSALHAIGCTSTPVAPATRQASKAAPAEPAASSSPSAQQPVALGELTLPMSATTQPPINPDRARIAALATQHQPAVVRGDSAAEYIVMVLDAADQYVWSTSGSGNLSIEVAGDPRTPAERREYNSRYEAEYWGTAGRRGSVSWEFAAHDSLFTRYYAGSIAAAGGAGGGAARGRGTGTIAVGMDSAWKQTGRRYTFGFLRDTSAIDLDAFVRPGIVYGRGGARSGGAGDTLAGAYQKALTAGVGGSARGGRGARGGGGGTADAAPGTYKAGWSGTRNGPLSNQASGLEDPAPGQSGIEGLASSSVSSAEMYRFPAGELAPQMLRIMVVHLTPGTVWKGR